MNFRYGPRAHATRLVVALLLVSLAACGGDSNTTAPPTPIQPPKAILSVASTPIATFIAPWAIAFLPDGRMLVTDNKTLMLSVVTQAGAVAEVAGLPLIGGLFDVVLSPNFATDKTIYLTVAEPNAPGEPRVGRQSADATIFSGGLALISATFTDAGLVNVKVIWRQTPKLVAQGEFGGRIAFSPDHRFLFLTCGDRAEFLPSNELDETLGKTIRLNLDGTIPADNPFVNTPGAKGEIWSMGHRNHYGLAFAPDGRLWSSEHGPKGGDEFNLIISGANYGWPGVSSGDNYDGSLITKPAPGDGFATAAIVWTPAIAPGGMIFYTGSMFKDWNGDAILAGMVSKALIRVRISGDTAAEVQRIDMGVRIREVEQGPDGAIWALEDSPSGRLVKLAPVFQ